MDINISVEEMCKCLEDKNGNHIDVNELAGAYLSSFELERFFKRCTNYPWGTVSDLAKYIDKIEGNNYRFYEAAKVRKKLERAVGVRPTHFFALSILAILGVFCAVSFCKAAGVGVFSAAIIYVGFIFAICYACTYPQIQAKRKYGKDQFLFSSKFKFVGGLNLPQNVKCTVTCLQSNIAITSSGQEFNLPTKKIINVDVLTNTEIQKQYVSSVGGAVGGGVIGTMLLGPIGILGAAIGGAANKRSIKTNTKYLIFSYSGGDETKYIIFDVTGNVANANKFKNRFKALNKRDNIKVDL